MRGQLNKIIAKAEDPPSWRLPRIGLGNAAGPGGIFSLLQNPGLSVTEVTHVLSIDNDDPTAKWSRELFERFEIPKSAVTPWNTFGGYGEEMAPTSLSKNVPLCQALLDAALPAAVIAQGYWAHEMAERLRFSGPIFCVPHLSRLGRMKAGAGDEIEAGFRAAWLAAHQVHLIRMRIPRGSLQQVAALKWIRWQHSVEYPQDRSVLVVTGAFTALIWRIFH